jgi:hypothetical protein
VKYWYFKTLAVTIGPNNNTDGPWQTHQDEQGTKFGLMSLHISGQHILKKLNRRDVGSARNRFPPISTR